MKRMHAEMEKSIRSIKGIGPQAIQVFEEAGFYTVQHLKNFDGDESSLWCAIGKIRAEMKHALPAYYWRRLLSRCIDIIYRTRCIQASDFVPSEYMCPLTLDWILDPVVTDAGHSYSRAAIDEWLVKSRTDPLTGVNMAGGTPLYANVALSKAVDHYRLHYQHFRALFDC